MLFQEIIQPDRVLCNAHARSKKHCLEILSELLVRSSPDIPSDTIFEALIERERLGCTSLKKGLAFPHCRIDGLDDSFAAMIKLSEPIDFDAPDGEPVDLIFGMMVPAMLSDEDYADVKAMTGILADEGLRGRLRSTNSSSTLYEALVDGTDLFSSNEPRTATGG